MIDRDSSPIWLRTPHPKHMFFEVKKENCRTMLSPVVLPPYRLERLSLSTSQRSPLNLTGKMQAAR
jgi:hypothetical protein